MQPTNRSESLQHEQSLAYEALRKEAEQKKRPLFLITYTSLDTILSSIRGQETGEKNYIEGGVFRLITKAVEQVSNLTEGSGEIPSYMEERVIDYLANQLKQYDLQNRYVCLLPFPSERHTYLVQKALDRLDGIIYRSVSTREMENFMGIKQEAREARPQQPVLYICALGQERSVAAAGFEKEAGNKKADFLRGGYLGIELSVLGPLRARIQNQMGLLGKNSITPAEQVEFNTRLQREAKVALKNWLEKRYKHTLIRIFSDEMATNSGGVPMVGLLNECLQELRMPHELVTIDSMNREFQRTSGKPMRLEGWMRE